MEDTSKYQKDVDAFLQANSEIHVKYYNNDNIDGLYDCAGFTCLMCGGNNANLFGMIRLGIIKLPDGNRRWFQPLAATHRTCEAKFIRLCEIIMFHHSMYGDVNMITLDDIYARIGFPMLNGNYIRYYDTEELGG